MKRSGNKQLFRKTILSGAITAALGIGLGIPSVSQADIYGFSFTGLFTMLTATGKPLQNTSNPYYYDTTWAYGKRSQISGTLSFDTATGAGSGTVKPFNFYNKGQAVAQGVFFQSLATPANPTNPLMLGNMSFLWNKSNIATQIVLNGSGLFAALGGGIPPVGAVLDQAYCASSGACATPASDQAAKGKIPIGPVPIATSSFNTVGQNGSNTTTLGMLSLGTDDGIGGSPMDNGPFSGFNANFDMLSVTVTGYNDKTNPVLTVSPNTLSLPVGGAFNPNSPTGITVSCTDNADGTDTLAAAVNPNITFSILSNNVTMSTPGSYKVVYTCDDSAGARKAVTDPATGKLTKPVNNTSPSVTLTVSVAAAGQDKITLKGKPSDTLQACTLYKDPGATAVDGSGKTISNSITVTDSQSITTSPPNESSSPATIDYNVGTGSAKANTATRTVIIEDTLGPVINVPPITTESDKAAGFLLSPVTATDANNNCNPVAGGLATTTDKVNFKVLPGKDSVLSVIRYTATDTSIAKNTTTAQLKVTVERSEPVITLLDKTGKKVSVGDLTLVTGSKYAEYGMDIHDVQGGDLTAVTKTGSAMGTGARTGQSKITYTVNGTVDTAKPGDYFITYTATDSDGNKAATVKRKVTVANSFGIGNFTMLDASGFGVGGTNDVTYVWDGTFNSTSGKLDPADGYTIPSYTKSVMTIASPTPFDGFNWKAKAIRVFQGPAKLKFDVTCQDSDLSKGITDCQHLLIDQQAQQRYIKLDLASGEVGAHLLFDWGSKNSLTSCGVANCDIDVVLVWKQNAKWVDPDNGGKNNLYLQAPFLLKNAQGKLAPPALSAVWKLVSRVATVNGVGDGINGSPMIDGPFLGFHANFNLGLGSASSGVATKPPVVHISSVKSDASLSSMGLSMGLWGLLSALISILGLRRVYNKK